MAPKGVAAAVVCLVVSLAACVYPAERDADVHVTLTPLHILLRGGDTVATARAWQMMGTNDSAPISNVVFTWTSSDPGIATVDASGRVVGVNSGVVVITAAAANYDRESRAASETLRVSAPLEIDSIRPKTVQYGQMVAIYGVGVDSIFSATLSGAPLIPVPYSDTVYAGGTARSRWWVPPPARTDSLFFLGISGGNGIFGYVHGDTTNVLERDLYEPNDTNFQLLDLDAPPPFPQYPALVFYNPALAFEVLGRTQKSGADWYRLKQAEQRDVTVILSAPDIAGTFVTYLTDSLGWSSAGQKFVIGHDSWTFGPGIHACHGLPFTPSEAIADSTVVAFKALRAGTLDALAVYAKAGRYGLGIIAGYQSELPADAHEDDNSCNAADLRGVAATPFRDTLTIENPHDMDWIRFHYTNPGLGYTAQIRMHAFTGIHPDSLKDLDLYVFAVPNPGDVALQLQAADTSAGSDVNLRPNLATGDYYLAVVDYAGTATTYEVCVAPVNTLLGNGSCAATGFPAPPERAAIKSAVRRAAAPRLQLAR